MSDFNRAVTRTLEEEGVFSDHDWDPGGATKYGITEAVARRHGIPVLSLTADEARDIYHSDYWIRPGFHLIESVEIACELFDTEVNTGRSCVIAQRALVRNLFVIEADIGGIDGKWGPKTRGAINETARRYERHLLAALNGEQYRYYHRIKRSNPELFQRAIRGWMKRVGPPVGGYS